MMRALFFEYPGDKTAWSIDDEYLFGSDLLVAPLIEDGDTRPVYLPPGTWIDYQTGRTYSGGTWHEMTAGEIPVILLVKNQAVIPHIAVAQSTADLDWSKIELRVFSTENTTASGLFSLPDGELHPLTLTAGDRD